MKAALTNIPTVLRDLGYDKGWVPNRRGKMILCPGHNEHVPSCGVTLGESGTIRVHCFSQCGFVGDVFSLIAKRYQLDLRQDFAEIVAIGADLAGITLDDPPRGPDGSPKPRPKLRLLPPLPAQETVEARPPATIDEEIALGKAVDVLSRRFPVESDPGIAAGLAKRQLLEEASAEGWAVLPKTGLVTLFDVPELEALRPLIVRQNAQGRDFAIFRDHRLVIPWRRPDGRVWSFQRRFSPKDGTEDPKKLGLGVAEPGQKPKHIPKFVWPSALDYVPRESFPYGVDSYAAYDTRTEESWWAEGASDVLSLRILNREGWLTKDGSARRMEAFGLPGVQTLEVYLPALTAVTKGRRGVIGVDGDAAGQTVAHAWRATQIAVGAKESVIKVPASKDWNAFLIAQREGQRTR